MDLIIRGKKVESGDVLPVIPMRNLVIFPRMIVPLVIGRSKSIKATEKAFESNKLFFCITQRSPETQDPQRNDLYKIGVICQIIQLLKMPDTTIRVLVEGIKRARIVKYNNQKDLITSKLEIVESIYIPESPEHSALIKTLEAEFKEYAKLSRNFPEDVLITLENLDDLEKKDKKIATYRRSQEEG